MCHEDAVRDKKAEWMVLLRRKGVLLPLDTPMEDLWELSHGSEEVFPGEGARWGLSWVREGERRDAWRTTEAAQRLPRGNDHSLGSMWCANMSHYITWSLQKKKKITRSLSFMSRKRKLELFSIHIHSSIIVFQFHFILQSSINCYRPYNHLTYLIATNVMWWPKKFTEHVWRLILQHI